MIDWKVGDLVLIEKQSLEKPSHQGLATIVLIEGDYICWNYLNCSQDCGMCSGTANHEACNGCALSAAQYHISLPIKIDPDTRFKEPFDD